MRHRVALLALSLGVLISAVAGRSSQTADSCTEYGPRKDCGHPGITQKACSAKGCCWQPFIDEEADHGGPRLDLPACFHPNTHASVYALQGANALAAGSSEVKEARLVLKKAVSPELGLDVEDLKLTVDASLPDVLHVKIADADGKRWQVPTSLLAASAASIPDVARDKEEPHKYEHVLREEPFSFEVTRTSDPPGSAPIWNTTGHRLLFKEQYLEITSWVPATSTLYGLGERISSAGLPLHRDGRPLALWNRDCTDYPDLNLYGSHPFLLEVRPDGRSHGVLLWNSNGMDAVLTEDSASFRVTGGVLDLYFFLGPSPMQVLEQFTRLFGRPAMQPLWALGFHQSKYGYSSIWEMEEVVANYSAAGIPLDVMWGDIDYMERWRDFTFDPVNFPLPAVQTFVEKLHEGGRRFVPILDPGIPLLPGYAPYEDGIKRKVFLRDVTGSPYIGEVWPGPVHFPDFISREGQRWWLDQVRAFYADVPFDGLWVDMNEPSNFCTGHVCELPPAGLLDFVDHSDKPFFTFGTEPPACQLQCWSLEPYLKQWLLQEQSFSHTGNPDASGALLGSLVKGAVLQNGTRPWQDTNLEREEWEVFVKVDTPPYAIANNNVRLPLSFRTVPVTARHVDGTLQYNTHNIYGLSQAAATSRALDELFEGRKRSFVLTRSTFVGSGGHAAHWTGDNAATWDDLRWSVVGVLEAGLLGMPMAGADICGFLGITTEELCARWISAGAFYPLARDHADLNSGYQELYRWPGVVAAARTALGLRYQLLPYLYSAYRRTAGHGCPLARPLFLGWPSDPLARTADRQWLMGDSVLITPVLEEGADSVRGYFPQGVWYNISDVPTVDASTTGRHVVLPAPLGAIPVHVLGGSIVPMQEARLTTAEVARTPLTLVVALSRTPLGSTSINVRRCGPLPPERALLARTAGRAQVAWGQLYIDAGDQKDLGPASSGWLNLRAEAQPYGTGVLTGAFSSTGEWDREDDEACAEGLHWPVLDSVRVLGLPGRIDEASIKFELVSQDSSKATAVKANKVFHVNDLVSEAHIVGLGHKLECPHGFRLTWKLEKLTHADELR